MDIALSRNNIPVRLTNERWYHITTGHPEMAAYYDDILETIEKPEFLYLGSNEEYLAVRNLDNVSAKFVVVIYKEVDKNDGFIITSFLTNKEPYFAKKKLIWKQ